MYGIAQLVLEVWPNGIVGEEELLHYPALPPDQTLTGNPSKAASGNQESSWR